MGAQFTNSIQLLVSNVSNTAQSSSSNSFNNFGAEADAFSAALDTAAKSYSDKSENTTKSSTTDYAKDTKDIQSAKSQAVKKDTVEKETSETTKTNGSEVKTDKQQTDKTNADSAQTDNVQADANQTDSAKTEVVKIDGSDVVAEIPTAQQNNSQTISNDVLIENILQQQVSVDISAQDTTVVLNENNAQNATVVPTVNLEKISTQNAMVNEQILSNVDCQNVMITEIDNQGILAANQEIDSDVLESAIKNGAEQYLFNLLCGSLATLLISANGICVASVQIYEKRLNNGVPAVLF